MKKLVQFKLVNGDEIVGEVKAYSPTGNISLQNVLSIERMVFEKTDEFGNVIGSGAMYTMKSWFVDQFDENTNPTIIIPENSIVARMNPAKSTFGHYESSLSHITTPTVFLDSDEDEDEDEDDPDYPELSPLKSLVKPTRMN